MAGNVVAEYLADEEATEAFGRQVATALLQDRSQEQRGAVITLQGELGAGKTTLARGFMRGFGYTGAVKSPTYTLVEPYELPVGDIYHFDLYRISDPKEIRFLGVDEYFASTNICLIEWPERGGGSLPAADLEIRLDGSGSGRTLHWCASSDRGRQLVERFQGLRRNA